MARITDHPIRIARIRANLSQQKLANMAGIQRSALTAIEDGRTKMPTDRLIETLASHFGTTPNLLKKEIEEWQNKPVVPTLKASAKNLLEIPPYVLAQYYGSFTQWRKELATTQTAFASMLRINPAIIRDYESGKYERMPDGLAGKMLQTFESYGFGPDYLVALENLPRG